MKKASSSKNVVNVVNDFKMIASHGWADPYNSSVSSMSWFNNHLLCGTTRAGLCLLKKDEMSFQWKFPPIKCPSVAEDYCAKIFSLDTQSGQWQVKYTSPLLKRHDGQLFAQEVGISTLLVTQHNNEDVLYVGTMGNRGSSGGRLLCSSDGDKFIEVHRPDPGKKGISSFSTLISFNDKLFTTIVNTGTGVNSEGNTATVFVNEDPRKSEWKAASTQGFGERWNIAISALLGFNGFLYAVTQNPAHGFQLWKSKITGKAPYEWIYVLGNGCFRQHFNRGAISLCVFNQALYIGTGIMDTVASRGYRKGVAGAEIIRVYADDSWDLVMGSSRPTKQGFKQSLSGLSAGFNDYFNRDITQMIVHNEHLYAATFNWMSFMPFIETQAWGGKLQSAANTIKSQGFSLWRSAEGEKWHNISKEGLGNAYHCAIESMISSKSGLLIGSANPFGPELGHQLSDQSVKYEVNKASGAAVWLGKSKALKNEVAEPLLDADLFQLNETRIKQLADKIDLSAILATEVATRYEKNTPIIEGLSNLPRSAALLIANHPGSPMMMGKSAIMEDTLMILHLLQKERPAVRHLADLQYYNTAERLQHSRNLVEKLGFVPETLDNGIRLLQQQSLVLIHPERALSKPGYETREFNSDFAKMAWETRSPIIPMIFLGPQERQLKVEYNDEQVAINPLKPLAVVYKLIILPEMRIRLYVNDINNSYQVNHFVAMVRRKIQEKIELEAKHRPLIKVAREVQQRYGGQ